MARTSAAGMLPDVLPPTAAYCTSASNTYAGSPGPAASSPFAAAALRAPADTASLAPEADPVALRLAPTAEDASRAAESSEARDTHAKQARKTKSHSRRRPIHGDPDPPPDGLLDEECTSSTFGPPPSPFIPRLPPSPPTSRPTKKRGGDTDWTEERQSEAAARIDLLRVTASGLG
uniref:Uncharacterized protein n=1 Tax=Triticum urartu TaxID=4572 RepID=A0A8R7R502_TRIUA